MVLRPDLRPWSCIAWNPEVFEFVAWESWSDPLGGPLISRDCGPFLCCVACESEGAVDPLWLFAATVCLGWTDVFFDLTLPGWLYCSYKQR